MLGAVCTMSGVRPIDRGLVDEVWGEVLEYHPARLQMEAAAFLDQQPHVGAFTTMVGREFDDTVQRTAFGLAFLLFKVLERSRDRSFPVLAEEPINAAYEANVDWLAALEGGEAALMEAAEAGPEPNPLAYILSVFYEGDGDPGGYDIRVRANLYLMLKTLTEAVDGGPTEG
jgi:hypothetical protein